MTEEIKPLIPVETGTTALVSSSGWVMDEFLRELRGRRGMATYREMLDNDPVIGAVFYAIEMLTRQVDWTFATPDDSSESQAEADFLAECLGDMDRTWQEYLSEFLTCVGYGYSLGEIVYKYRLGKTKDKFTNSRFRDGRVGWRGFPARPQESIERWEIDRHGYVHSAEQWDPNNGARYILPLDKVLHFRVRSHKNNPEGRSLFRNAYNSYYYAKQLRSIEAIGIERDMAGVAVARVPREWFSANATSEEKAALQQWQRVVQLMRRNQNDGIVIPGRKDNNGNDTPYDLELLSSGGRPHADVDRAIRRHETRIAQVALGEFIMLGQEPNGSRSLADSKTSMFVMAVRAILDTVTAEFNRKAVAQLMTLNGVHEKHWPQLTYGDIEDIDLTQMAATVAAFADRGMITPSKEDEDWIRERIGMPERTNDLSRLLQQGEAPGGGLLGMRGPTLGGAQSGGEE
jgi:hypothetical protein